MGMLGNVHFLSRIRTRFRRGSLPVHYAAVFGQQDGTVSPSGLVVLHDIVREGGVMTTSGGGTNEELQFAEGKRYLALYILGMLRIEPQEAQNLAEREVFDE